MKKDIHVSPAECSKANALRPSEAFWIPIQRQLPSSGPTAQEPHTWAHLPPTHRTELWCRSSNFD